MTRSGYLLRRLLVREDFSVAYNYDTLHVYQVESGELE